jgi:hypothetical protein
MALLARWRSLAQGPAGCLARPGGLSGFVAAVYVVVVLGGGALIGHTSSPHLGLSVLATAIVALWRSNRCSAGWRRSRAGVYHGRPSPYDVAQRFTEAVTGSYASDEVPARMAKVLADGTGARWAQVCGDGQRRPRPRPRPGRQPSRLIPLRPAPESSAWGGGL